MNNCVSVIIPFYNNEKYLEHCIQSVCDQTYKELNIILVDDGSTDRSLSIAQKFAAEDNRIQLLHESNSGVCRARNYGISKASGKYLTFVDGDDYIGKQYIDTLVTVAEINQADVVFCGYTSLNAKNGRKKGVIPTHFEKGKDEIWAYRISGVCSRLYLRQFWTDNDLKFLDEPGARGEDIPIVLYTNAIAKNIHVSKTAEYYYVQHQGSAMHSGGKVLFNFPFRAFSEVYKKVRKQFSSMNSESCAYFSIGVVKALAQFEYLIYRKSPDGTRKKFQDYVLDLIGLDLDYMNTAWQRLRHTVELPLQHKAAITFFLRKYTGLRN